MKKDKKMSYHRMDDVRKYMTPCSVIDDLTLKEKPEGKSNQLIKRRKSNELLCTHYDSRYWNARHYPKGQAIPRT